MYKVMHGKSPWIISQQIEFGDNDESSARWMYGLICSSDDDDKKYAEIYLNDGVFKRKIERQLKY